MRFILPLAAALVVGLAPAMARDDSFSDRRGPEGPHGTGLYDRIAAHYGPAGRTVKEKYRDGPCKISRKWEKDGDYEEVIKCRGPRD